MAFELKNVVPWGRNMDEYTSMFMLTDEDLEKRIAGFGDGPASFNVELTTKGGTVVSIDPLYRFTKDQIRQRIAETKDIVERKTRANQSNFVWKNIRNVDHLMEMRLEAMDRFLDDFDCSRYLAHEMPDRTSFLDQTFDIGLSSHFLMLYPGLGLEFHLRTLEEMLRICKEVRIFPLLNLDAEPSEMLESIIQYFQSTFRIEILQVDYEFQKGGNQMLRITRKA